jgi:hypothetical protein
MLMTEKTSLRNMWGMCKEFEVLPNIIGGLHKDAGLICNKTWPLPKNWFSDEYSKNKEVPQCK